MFLCCCDALLLHFTCRSFATSCPGLVSPSSRLPDPPSRKVSFPSASSLFGFCVLKVHFCGLWSVIFFSLDDYKWKWWSGECTVCINFVYKNILLLWARKVCFYVHLQSFYLTCKWLVWTRATKDSFVSWEMRLWKISSPKSGGLRAHHPEMKICTRPAPEHV